MGSNHSTESNYKSEMNSKDKMQMLCMKNGTTAEGYNRRREPRNIKHSSTESATNGGHSGILYPPPGAPPAGLKPRPAKLPEKPEQQAGKQNKPSPRGEDKEEKFMEGLRSDLLPFVLAGAPVTYADALNRVVYIDEGLLNMHSRSNRQLGKGIPGSINNNNWDFKEMGIDQLGFQSVQLGYLKILQMGNADPNNPKYGPLNPYIPFRSTTIGKSIVAIDPIAMRTSWRSNSDIANSIGYPRMSASGESSTTMHRLLHASGSHPITPPDDPKHDNFSLLKIATSLVTSNTTGTSLELKSRSSHSQQKTLLNSHKNLRIHSFIAFPLQRQLRPPNWYQSKSYSRRSQRYQSRSKQRWKSTEIYRRSLRMNSIYRGFTGENYEKYWVQNTISVDQHLQVGCAAAERCGRYQQTTPTSDARAGFLID
ncbi:hypothetical protein F511_15122 [Dorcoceras hygrometricum]|uniref:Uncharacterized protein n=1 Tax=Dorcoceras hygrometricum TaxID=472368 RepID=A0A2Z7BTR9_9LAMI|nr:hypothetical protein F511_15122 [Dorcoceras hygrometricum]